MPQIDRIITVVLIIVTVLVIFIAGVNFASIFELNDYFAQWKTDHPAALISDASCEDGNECTYDRSQGASPGYCTSAPFSRKKTCTSSCYINGTKTHCDANGTCIGDDETTCLGYCERFDNNSVSGTLISGARPDLFYVDVDLIDFPIKPYFFNATTPDNIAASGNTANKPIFVASFCYANTKIFTSLQLVFDIQQSPYPPNVGAVSTTTTAVFTDCDFMLDESSPLSACITTTSHAVDSYATQLLWYNTLLTPASKTVYTELNTTYTMRLCVFQYACAQPNVSAYADHAYWTADPRYSYMMGSQYLFNDPYYPPYTKRSADATTLAPLILDAIASDPERKAHFNAYAGVQKRRFVEKKRAMK